MNTLRVLLVEDTPEHREAFKQGLEKEGLEIIDVPHVGKEGEEVKSHILETDGVHAVLLDLIMEYLVLFYSLKWNRH